MYLRWIERYIDIISFAPVMREEVVFAANSVELLAVIAT
jgi:hypothetical protein